MAPSTHRKKLKTSDLDFQTSVITINIFLILKEPKNLITVSFIMKFFFFLLSFGTIFSDSNFFLKIMFQNCIDYKCHLNGISKESFFTIFGSFHMCEKPQKSQLKTVKCAGNEIFIESFTVNLIFSFDS